MNQDNGWLTVKNLWSQDTYKKSLLRNGLPRLSNLNLICRINKYSGLRILIVYVPNNEKNIVNTLGIKETKLTSELLLQTLI